MRVTVDRGKRGQGLTREEWLEVRAQLPDELRERTLEEV